MSQKQKRNLSRALTKILRHSALDMGLTMNHEGYVPLRQILKMRSLKGFHPTLEKIRQIVAENDKQRFSLIEKKHQWYIRANQGHSGGIALLLDDEKMLDPLDPDTDTSCVHGTYMRYWGLIKKGGLSRMSRKHIHMSSRPYRCDKTISGMRSSCNLLIHIDYKKAIAAGIPFYVSDNQVILSPGNDDGCIPVEFFLRVEEVIDRVAGTVRDISI